MISKNLTIPLDEIEFKAIRSQGAGGQNVNKVSTAIHLCFDIKSSSLPEKYIDRLLNLDNNRITKDGIIIIKSQQYRSQLKNKEIAISRLHYIIKSVLTIRKERIPTKPTLGSQEKRLESKKKRSRTKDLRKRIID